MADWLDGGDADLVFAELQGLLSGPMAAHLRRGRVDTQVLEGQRVLHAVVKDDLEHPRLRAQAQVCDTRFHGHPKGVLLA